LPSRPSQGERDGVPVCHRKLLKKTRIQRRNKK
jgi:hypothetical protein